MACRGFAVKVLLGFWFWVSDDKDSSSVD